MGEQLTTSAEALRLFFDDDVYLIRTDEPVAAAAVAELKTAVAQEATVIAQAEVKIVVPVPQNVADVPKTTIPEVQTLVPEITIPAAEAPVKEAQVQSLAPVKETAIESSAPATSASQPLDFKYLGKNQKNILILVNDSQHDVSTERGRELLRNIVKAIQLTANDFALLNYSGYAGTPYAALDQFFSSKLVMSFGVPALQLGLTDFAKNTLHLQGTTQLVFSENLDVLAEDLQGKKTLWGSLKQITL